MKSKYYDNCLVWMNWLPCTWVSSRTIFLHGFWTFLKFLDFFILCKIWINFLSSGTDLPKIQKCKNNLYLRPVLTFYKFHRQFWQFYCHLNSCLVSIKCHRHYLLLFFLQHGATVCHYFWDLILLLNLLHDYYLKCIWHDIFY